MCLVRWFLVPVMTHWWRGNHWISTVCKYRKSFNRFTFDEMMMSLLSGMLRTSSQRFPGNKLKTVLRSCLYFFKPSPSTLRSMNAWLTSMHRNCDQDKNQCSTLLAIGCTMKYQIGEWKLDNTDSVFYMVIFILTRYKKNETITWYENWEGFIHRYLFHNATLMTSLLKRSVFLLKMPLQIMAPPPLK